MSAWLCADESFACKLPYSAIKAGVIESLALISRRHEDRGRVAPVRHRAVIHGRLFSRPRVQPQTLTDATRSVQCADETYADQGCRSSDHGCGEASAHRNIRFGGGSYEVYGVADNS